MARPRIGLHAYADLIPILQRGLDGTITLDCGNDNAAIRTNQRMNQLRVLQRQDNNGESPYDNLIFRRRGAHIIVELRGPPALKVIDADGNEIGMDMFVPALTQQQIEHMIKNAPKRASAEIEAQLAAARAEHEKDYEPPVREHLHEIDPGKPLLDDVE